MLKSHSFRGFLICLAATFLVLLLFLLGALDGWERATLDFRFRMRGSRPVNPDIAVITIDEESIDKLGRWPWPREVHGRLIRALAKAGAAVVAFDTLFTEVDASNPRSDAALAAAAKDTGRVVSAFFVKQLLPDNHVAQPALPYPALRDASRLGFVNLDPDPDGVTRRAPLFLIEENPDGKTTLVRFSVAVSAWALAHHFSDEETLKKLPGFNPNGIDASSNQMLINFAFDPTSPTGYAYPTYSYIDVLDGKIPADRLRGKILFVGATAAALFDMKAIPYVSKHPGVMVHANVLDNLMGSTFLKEVSPGATALTVLFIGLLLGVFLPWLSPWAKLAVFVGVSAVIGAGGMVFFNTARWVTPMAAPLATALACYGGTMFYRLLIEEREKRKIRGSFRQYLSPKIIEIITRDPSQLRLGGEERDVSVFFLDIAGFTKMSEALKPTQLVEIMNHCLTEFSSVILRHDGLIDKYIGDCIMAFWNAPADQPRHASLACFAALDCIRVLPDINRRLQEKGLPTLDCRIGINTGRAIVGNMGSIEKFNYTVMGDPVNLASRLEGANKSYHTHVMISETTFEQAREDIEARDLDLIRVMGKKEPSKVFEVLCRKGEMSPELQEGRTRFHQGLSLYRKKSFEEAIQAFETVFEFLPNDHVSRVYLERARQFVIHPPPAAWDGVYEMLTK